MASSLCLRGLWWRKSPTGHDLVISTIVEVDNLKPVRVDASKANKVQGCEAMGL